jgi:UDPglucose--hexose-1-phosphate uridylyltransferase
MPMMQAQKWFSYVPKDGTVVQLDVLKWPVSVIRLRSAHREALITEAMRIFDAWRGYSDVRMSIVAETTARHNTITPIARRILSENGEMYELNLALRNNRTSAEHPEGIFHPHREHHHIKKENIGLIEVMGLAVLPARLKDELTAIAELIAGEGETAILRMESSDSLAKHVPWVMTLYDSLKVQTRGDANAVYAYLAKAVGYKFQAVLEDAGVFKDNKAAFISFLDYVYA